MSDTKKTTKLAAVAASLALVASGGLYAFSMESVARAEEDDTTLVDTDGTESTDETQEGTLAQTHEDEGEEPGDEIPSGGDEGEGGDDAPGDEEEDDPADDPAAPVMDALPEIHVTPDVLTADRKIKVSITQAGPTEKNDGFDSFKMTLNGLPQGFTADDVDDIVVRQGADVLCTLNGEDGQVGAIIPTSSGYTYSIDGRASADDAEFLSTQMSYNESPATWSMEMTLTVPSDIVALRDMQLPDDGNGNLIARLNVSGNTTTTSPAAPEDNSRVAASVSKDIAIPMPKLSVTKASASTKSAQVFDTVTYSFDISNEAGRPDAKGIEITDEEFGDQLHIMGINPESITAQLTKSDNTKVDISNNFVIDPKTGNISYYNPDLVIKGGEHVKITYSIDTRKNQLGETGHGTLADLLATDMNGAGQRKATVRADNALSSAEAEISYDMLRPDFAAEKPAVSKSKDTITTGEKSTVTVTFKTGGEAGSKIDRPSINLTTPVIGRLENANVRIGATTYALANMPTSVDSGQDIVLSYDLVAPSTYSKDVNNGISATATLSAANIVNSVSATASVAVAIPSFNVEVEAKQDKNEAPSAEDSCGTDHPVKVTATLTEKDAKARATGVQFVITDAPAVAGKVPTSRIFQDVAINGAKATAGTHYNVFGNKLVIERDVMEPGEKITVTYNDYLKSGYEANGYEESIVCAVERNAGKTSNIPDDALAKTYTAGYVIQTPQLHIAKEVTDPLDEVTEGEGEDAVTKTTPAVINVGDTVKYKTTFFEGNPEMKAALGRDFVLTESIEDLFISNEKESDKKANDEAEKTGDDERDIVTIADDEKKDGRTYKASQLGIAFCPVEDIKLMAGEEDVTDRYNVRLSDDNTKLTVTLRNDKGEELSGDLTKVPTDLIFAVRMGKAEEGNSYDQLSGKEIKVASNLSVSNLALPMTAVSTTKIADAEIHITKEVKDKVIAAGATDTYTITAENDPDDKFDSSSAVRKMKIEDDLDEAAAKFGYKIDRSTLKVMLGDEDITSTSDVVVLWEDGDTGFDVDLGKDLAKDEKLVITYDATTVEIPASSYSQSLGNVVIATADNSKPAVAAVDVSYSGLAIPDDPRGRAGTWDDSFSGTGNIGEMGDTTLFAIAGVMAVAIAGGAIFLVIRRRDK